MFEKVTILTGAILSRGSINLVQGLCLPKASVGQTTREVATKVGAAKLRVYYTNVVQGYIFQ